MESAPPFSDVVAVASTASVVTARAPLSNFNFPLSPLSRRFPPFRNIIRDESKLSAAAVTILKVV